MNNTLGNVLSENKHSREMSAEERKDVIKTMKDNFDNQDEPSVGIFWYDKGKDELFGVTKIGESELRFSDKGLKTVGMLHKTWWNKQRMRAKAKNDRSSIYMRDYTKIPRGRIFQRKDGTFHLMCGSWINDHIVDLVKDEFNLQGAAFQIVVDIHWEIGHGWSEEYGI